MNSPALWWIATAFAALDLVAAGIALAATIVDRLERRGGS